VEPFLEVWARSVEAQSDRSFDLWISLDLVTPGEIRDLLGRDLGATWLTNAPGTTPAQIRLNGIRGMLERYDQIVFVDSDDVLHPTRVEAARRALADCDVSGCGLRLIDEKGRDLDALFGLNPAENADFFLPRWNVFGLSNSAYRAEVLKKCLPPPPDCSLVDWFLITMAWAMGARITFDATPRMGYRRHGRNTAPVLPPFDPGLILRAARQVCHHYRCLPARPKHEPLSRRWKQVRTEQARAEEFHGAVCENPAKLELYAEALARLSPRCVWWWAVAHPELEYLWKS
jgi:hypothetical protein